MFEPSSRYTKLAVKTHVEPAPDENVPPRELRYVERRFLPPSDAGVPLLEHTVADGERLDQVAARYLGDPTQFWRIADANLALQPETLTDTAGRRIIVALPAS